MRKDEWYEQGGQLHAFILIHPHATASTNREAGGREALELDPGLWSHNSRTSYEHFQRVRLRSTLAEVFPRWSATERRGAVGGASSNGN